MDRVSFVALHVITIDFAAEVDIMRFDAAIRSALSQLAAVTLPVVGVLLVSVASATRRAGYEKDSCQRRERLRGRQRRHTLPPGFRHRVRRHVGHARHMVVAPTAWSTSTPGAAAITPNENAKAPDGGFLVALQDTTGGGRADKAFASARVESGNAGGTGIALYNGALYAETNDRIVRYALPPGAIAPTGAPEVVVSGLPLTGDHPMHPFEIDAQGALYVDVGSATNACQRQNRIPNSRASSRARSSRRGPASGAMTPTAPVSSSLPPSASPPGCATAKASQSIGRQDFGDPAWPGPVARELAELYNAEQGANEPAEELVSWNAAPILAGLLLLRLSQQKLVLAPEYGGDGGKAIGLCADKRAPVAVFPAHWAPNDLASTTGSSSPRLTAAVRSSPSTDRGIARLSRKVATTSCSSRSRTASRRAITWCSPTASPVRQRPGQAAYRPSGVAVGPDGALYIADDQRGRIWRISSGAALGTAIAAAPATARRHPDRCRRAARGHASRRRARAACPALRATPAEVALGQTFTARHVRRMPRSRRQGHAARARSHRREMAVGRRQHTIDRQGHHRGSAKAEGLQSPMPPMGGAQLSPSEVSAVAIYIWALSHRSGTQDSTGKAR